MSISKGKKRFHGFDGQTKGYKERNKDSLISRGVKFATDSRVEFNDEEYGDDLSGQGNGIQNRPRIALVVGHRRGSQGAVNTDGISEYEFWKRYLNAHVDLFPTSNEYRIFYRQDFSNSYTENMEELTNRINNFDADVAISFHFNASDNSSAEGYEILHSKSKTSKMMARTLIDNMSTYMVSKNRGLKRRTKRERGGGFLYRTKMPAILVEPYFGSSQKDTDEFVRNINGFTSGLIDFFHQL